MPESVDAAMDHPGVVPGLVLTDRRLLVQYSHMEVGATFDQPIDYRPVHDPRPDHRLLTHAVRPSSSPHDLRH
jgi:hypothetical protein